MSIITYVEPKGFGKKTRVFLYPENKIIEIDVPHKIYSKPLSPLVANDVLKEIERDKNLKGNVKVVALGGINNEKSKERCVVIYEGTRNDWKHLPIEIFFVHKSANRGDFRDSATKRLREYFSLPFAVVDNFIGDNFNPDVTLRKAKLEELLSFETECYDVEVIGYKGQIFSHINDLDVSTESLQKFLGNKFGELGVIFRSKDMLVKKLVEYMSSLQQMVYCIGYSFGGEMVLYTLLPVEDFEFETLLGRYKVRVKRFFSEEDMVIGFLEDKKRNNALVSIGQNMMAYDRLVLKTVNSKAKPVFKEGMDSSLPIIDARCGFYPRVIAKGFYSIDSAADSQNWNIGTPDNKLFTIFKHFFAKNFSLGEVERYMKKQHSYEEQTKLALEGLLGNKESALKIAEYCMEDVVATHAIGKFILEHVYDMGLLFEKEPDSICTVSRKRLSIDYFERKHINKHGTMEVLYRRRELEGFDHEEYFPFCFGDEKISEAEFANIGLMKGLFDDVTVVYQTVLLKALLPIVLGDENARRIYEKVPFVKDESLKLRYLVGLQAWLKKPLFDLLFIKDQIGFKEKYGMDLIEARNRLTEFSKVYKLLLKREINHSKYFSVIDGDVSELRNKRLCMLLCRGRVLSVGRGKFAWFAGNRVCTQGIDVFGRKGDRFNYERELIEKINHTVLVYGNVNDAIALYREGLENIVHADKADLVIVKENMRKDFFEYSSPAMRREFIYYAILHGAKKGEKFGYGYVKGNPGFASLHEFMQDGVEVDWGRYINKLKISLFPIMNALGFKVE